MATGGIHKTEHRAVYCLTVWKVLTQCRLVREDLLSIVAGLSCNRVHFLLPAYFYPSVSNWNTLRYVSSWTVLVIVFEGQCKLVTLISVTGIISFQLMLFRPDRRFSGRRLSSCPTRPRQRPWLRHQAKARLREKKRERKKIAQIEGPCFCLYLRR